MRTRLAALLGFCAMPVVALCFAASTALAQERVPFRQEELDQMLAPIALYPDPLLAQILMASTYPLEVVQAARWTRANPGLKGEAAAQAAEPMDWDPSVKSLTAFPHLLQMMDERLDWTERLGEAFLAQQADVMESVQALRRRAEAAGNLQSGEHMRVERQGEAIVIEPSAPDVVYVPYYSPAVVYGAWPWPAYPPVFWGPPAHYVVHSVPSLFVWGPGFVISTGFFFGHADWHHRHVVVHKHVRRVHGHRSRVIHHVEGGRAAWRHDPVHRRGVPFRTAAARRQATAERNAALGGGSASALRRAEVERRAEARQRRFDQRVAAARVTEHRGGAATRRDRRASEETSRPSAGSAALRPAEESRAREARRQAAPDRRSAAQPRSRGEPRARQPAAAERRSLPRGEPRQPRASVAERRASRPQRATPQPRPQARAPERRAAHPRASAHRAAPSRPRASARVPARSARQGPPVRARSAGRFDRRS